MQGEGERERQAVVLILRIDEEEKKSSSHILFVRVSHVHHYLPTTFESLITSMIHCSANQPAGELFSSRFSRCTLDGRE